MSVGKVILDNAALVKQVGKATLNTMYPKEFEVYMCALELVDETEATLKYFIFPVMPSNIEENKPEITNIKKTLAGVVSLSNPTFIPGDISLSGSFGRKFRVLLGQTVTDITSSFTTTKGKMSFGSAARGVSQLFSDNVKTGYGCYKVLEDIIAESKIVDENGIRRLYFYNLALGNNYLVKPLGLKASMSEENNMIWNYVLSMKTIAPLDSIRTAKQNLGKRFRLNATGYLQHQVQDTVNVLTSMLF